MKNTDLPDTQSIQPGADANRQDLNVTGNPQSPPTKPPAQKRASGRRLPRWVWAFPIVILALLAAAGGALAGFNSGQHAVHASQAQQADQVLKDQYDLALQDLQAGRYEVARQRLVYVITQDPAYPGAQDKLAQAISILYATATPTPLPPTSTPTPTRDLRPVQDLFTQAVSQVSASDWDGALNTLTSLRGADPNYQTAKVDAMIYTALRNRGVDHILKKGDLEGGSYDLALAEQFGPLDSEAVNVRNWARLYMYGNSFWGADPARAIYYFSQVASAAPYLTDGSGWTAMARYREVLIQYGDLLGKQEKWCDAEQQYQLALNIRVTNQLQSTLGDAAEKCSPPTDTEMPTETPTITPSPTIEYFPTETLTPAPQATTQPAPTTQTVNTPTFTATTEPLATTEAAPTAEHPTATNTAPTPTTKPPTATKAAPTPTTKPPTATKAAPTPTTKPPTATKAAPTPTTKPPTATKAAPSPASTNAPAIVVTDTATVLPSTNSSPAETSGSNNTLPPP